MNPAPPVTKTRFVLGTAASLPAEDIQPFSPVPEFILAPARLSKQA